jgi:hypothetical protein
MLFLQSPTQEWKKNFFAKFPRFETLCRLLSEELLANRQASFDYVKTSSPKHRYLNLQQTGPDFVQLNFMYRITPKM